MKNIIITYRCGVCVIVCVFHTKSSRPFSMYHLFLSVFHRCYGSGCGPGSSALLKTCASHCLSQFLFGASYGKSFFVGILPFIVDYLVPLLVMLSLLASSSLGDNDRFLDLSPLGLGTSIISFSFLLRAH